MLAYSQQTSVSHDYHSPRAKPILESSVSIEVVDPTTGRPKGDKKGSKRRPKLNKTVSMPVTQARPVFTLVDSPKAWPSLHNNSPHKQVGPLSPLPLESEVSIAVIAEHPKVKPRHSHRRRASSPDRWRPDNELGITIVGSDSEEEQEDFRGRQRTRPSELRCFAAKHLKPRKSKPAVTSRAIPVPPGWQSGSNVPRRTDRMVPIITVPELHSPTSAIPSSASPGAIPIPPGW